jgi:hypothetical protein
LNFSRFFLLRCRMLKFLVCLAQYLMLQQLCLRVENDVFETLAVR